LRSRLCRSGPVPRVVLLRGGRERAARVPRRQLLRGQFSCARHVPRGLHMRDWNGGRNGHAVSVRLLLPRGLGLGHGVLGGLVLPARHDVNNPVSDGLRVPRGVRRARRVHGGLLLPNGHEQPDGESVPAGHLLRRARGRADALLATVGAVLDVDTGCGQHVRVDVRHQLLRRARDTLVRSDDGRLLGLAYHVLVVRLELAWRAGKWRTRLRVRLYLARLVPAWLLWRARDFHV
jgi:hypothetical protein